MGFFKKIGRFTKKINLRGVGKVASKFTGMIPIVGNLATSVLDSAIAKGEQRSLEKKEVRAYEEQQRQAIEQQQKAIEQQMIQSKGYLGAMSVARNPNIGEILTAGAGGALTSIGGVLGGTTTAGQAGAIVGNSALNEWLKVHWWKLALGVATLGTVIFLAVRGGNKRR